MTIMEQLANHQGIKYAKNSTLTPRNTLGDFGTILALFASLAVQKTTLNRKTIKR
jgi:hypothetical protein